MRASPKGSIPLNNKTTNHLNGFHMLQLYWTQMMAGKSSRLTIALLVVLSLFIIGTFGYHFIEGLDYLQSFYLTSLTLTTVGYGDYYPHTRTGMVFTIFLVLFGVGTMLYTVGLLAETMIEGRLQILLGRGRLKKMIEKMENHYIICGCGRIGYLICRELYMENVDFVVIERNPEVIQKIHDEGYTYFRGDATQDKTLLAAGIKKAKGIVTVLPSDAENLYVILTAKELNPQIYILSRAEEEESEKRLLRAGANRVVSPYALGGMKMAMAIMRPAMLDFIEISTSRQNLELRMEEFTLGDKSPMVGKTLEESGIRQLFGLIIVAVKKDSGKMTYNPTAGYQIEKGDRLVAMGEEENLMKFSIACGV
jgi:voltage-gated potassium channel